MWKSLKSVTGGTSKSLDMSSSRNLSSNPNPTEDQRMPVASQPEPVHTSSNSGSSVSISFILDFCLLYFSVSLMNKCMNPALSKVIINNAQRYMCYALYLLVFRNGEQ